MSRPRELWGRRTVVVGAALVGAAILGGILLLILGSSDDKDKKGASPEDIAKLQNELLDKTVVDPHAGISVRRPSSWSDTKGDNIITLRSKNRCVAMTLAAPTRASQSNKLTQATIDAIRQTQKNVSFKRAGHGEIGGIPTVSYRVGLKNQEGDEVRALFSIGRGKKFAYLTQTVLGNSSCTAELATAQVIQTSIEYTK
jgi:hypothetical protein